MPGVPAGAAESFFSGKSLIQEIELKGYNKVVQHV